MTPDGTCKFADRLKEARQLRGFSTRELGKRASLSATMVSKLELGKVESPSVDVAARLADALGVARAWLLWGHTAEQKKRRL